MARLQALLTISDYLQDRDWMVLLKATERAVSDARAAADSIAATAAVSWPGPNLAALSLVALVRVRRGRQAGIGDALNAVEEMVSPATKQTKIQKLLFRFVCSLFSFSFLFFLRVPIALSGRCNICG